MVARASCWCCSEMLADLSNLYASMSVEISEPYLLTLPLPGGGTDTFEQNKLETSNFA